MHEFFYLGKNVEVIIDRPKGSKHPGNGLFYELNYGYLPNTVGGDGEEIDVYMLDVDRPIAKVSGTVVGIIIREDDLENKLLVSEKGKEFTFGQIEQLTNFQEQYFQTQIITRQAFQTARENLIGLTPGKVELKDNSAFWKMIFYQEAGEIRHKLGDAIDVIEHIGSTAIPYIKSKPIIDIMVGLPNFDQIPRIVAGMTQLGYRYKGENGIPGRHYFSKGDPRKFHVHMVKTGREIYRNHLKFRRQLIADPDLARAYEALKIDLARRYENNREQYTSGKDDFIQRVINA